MSAFVALLLAAAAPGYAVTPPSPTPGAPEGGQASLSTTKTKPGGIVKVTGVAWAPGSMVNIAVCGQNGLAGTKTCAVATSMNVPVATAGEFAVSIRVETPPVPCPCVIRVVTVTGGRSLDRAIPVEIEGAPFAAMQNSGKSPGRLTFIKSEMTGKDNVFTWFGSPVSRRFEIEVGNMGESPITNPVFRIGTFQGVYAPTWEDKTWNGTILPGQRVKVSLPIELKPRQHGEFRYRVMYDGRVVDEIGLKVGRPWGVYLFGGLLLIVVPMTVWRLGTSLVRAIRENRADRDAERDREVGVPGQSIIRRAEADAAAAETAAEAVPERAPEPVREPVLVPGGGTPLRRVEETMVVGAPLFARPAPALPAAGTAAELPSGAASSASSTASPAASAVSAAGPVAAPASAPPESPAEETRVLPSRPDTDPESDAEGGTPNLVRPSDVARGLAWGPGEERGSS
ncbi:hypothetical protein [Streptodolium elevatio]|uniref:Uncharacterized protein n=1 Tax=Streptodolium elevatio TaxID=3157996 RepID=A0ABV3DFW3_9ACTN